MKEPLVTLSIVSHGQGALVARLLADLRTVADGSFRTVVTLNIPEDESFLEPYASPLGLHVIRNRERRGFGANHNAAFAEACSTSAFAVLNPDLRLQASPLPALIEALRSHHGIGAVAPLVLSPTGAPEDSVRRFPTVAQLARRQLLGRKAPDYSADAGRQPVDWAAGMFVVFDSHAFRDVGGFDEDYFMYFEDADICRRLAALQQSTWWVPDASVVHHARRASNRQLRPMLWHFASAWRFLVIARLRPAHRRSQSLSP